VAVAVMASAGVGFFIFIRIHFDIFFSLTKQ